MKIVVTNQELYSQIVTSVDINAVKNVTDNSFYANILIEQANGFHQEFDGEFGYSSFEDEYGFIFEK